MAVAEFLPLVEPTGVFRAVADNTLIQGTVKLVSCLVAAKIGGRDRCIVVVQGTPVPAGDHRSLRVAISPVPAELS
jgi:hypothetical protein